MLRGSNSPIDAIISTITTLMSIQRKGDLIIHSGIVIAVNPLSRSLSLLEQRAAEEEKTGGGTKRETERGEGGRQ